MYSIILNQIIILFLIMSIGFCERKLNIIDEAARKKISELILHVTCPLLIISSFQLEFDMKILGNILAVLVFSIGIHVFAALIGLIAFRRVEEGKRKIMKFSLIYTNCGYIGLPLLESLYGRTGVLYGSLYVAVFNIFVWTNGISIIGGVKENRKEYAKNALLNPGIISVAIGMLLFIFSIKLPQPVLKTAELVGSMTLPLSMLVIGAGLAENNLKELFNGWELYYAAFLRLAAMPLLAYALLKLLGFSGMMLGVCVLPVAMPAGAVTAMFAEIYNGDALFASKVVAFTTLASMITIPAIMLIL